MRIKGVVLDGVHGKELEDVQIEDLINLMNVYLSEWNHRDELLWSQVFRYFYVTVVAIFLPNIAGFLGIKLPDKLPNIIFPIAGLLLSVVFLYVSIGYAKRLEAVGKTYQKLISYLPIDLQRYSLLDPEIKYGKYFHHPMSIVLCMLMFVGSFSLSVFMTIYYLQ